MSVLNESMEYVWVVGFFDPRTEIGKSIQAHNSQGIGYVIQNPQRLKTDKIIAAFKYPADRPLPPHLQRATPQQVERLEARNK